MKEAVNRGTPRQQALPVPPPRGTNLAQTRQFDFRDRASWGILMLG
jgi:hypothetical protein